MSRSRKSTAKSQRERTAYGHSSRKQNRLDPTGQYGSSNLQGSADGAFGYDDDSDFNSQETGSMLLSTWLKRNKDKIIEVLVFGLVVAFICFAASWIFNTNAQISVIEFRVDQLQSKVDALDDEIVTKDILDLKLQLIKNDLSTTIPDLSDIEKRLSDIENRLEQLDSESKKGG